MSKISQYTFPLKLHAKVKAAFLTAIALAVTDEAAQITDHYPTSRYVPLLAIFVPVILGFLKKEEDSASDISTQVDVTETPVENPPAAEDA